MTWVLIIAVTWLVVSIVAALLIAGTISLADRRRTRPATSDQGNFAVDLPIAPAPVRLRATRARRRPVMRHGVAAEHPSEPWQTGTY